MLSEITTVLTQVAQWFVSIFTSLTGVFYTSTASGIELTFVGTMFIVGLGVFLVSMLLNWIHSLIRI